MLEQQLLQVYGCLLDQETCSALLDWFMPLEQTRVHWKEQNPEWWELFRAASHTPVADRSQAVSVRLVTVLLLTSLFANSGSVRKPFRS